jgi:hypothetical protein
MAALRVIDPLIEYMPIQDQLRTYFDRKSTNVGRNIPVTVRELQDNLKLTYAQAYQGVKRLENSGEISLEKEDLPNGREKITGITLHRLEPSGRTYRRAAERAKKVITDKKLPTIEADATFPELLEYLNKKLTIEELREHALNGGLDPSIISFEVSEIAEEALLLLQKVSDLTKDIETLRNEKQMLEFDLEAERRNSESYKMRLRQETKEDLHDTNTLS